MPNQDFLRGIKIFCGNKNTSHHYTKNKPVPSMLGTEGYECWKTTPQTQDVNWTYIRRSIYVLCLRASGYRKLYHAINWFSGTVPTDIFVADCESWIRTNANVLCRRLTKCFTRSYILVFSRLYLKKLALARPYGLVTIRLMNYTVCSSNRFVVTGICDSG